jgi:hypothetical protein
VSERGNKFVAVRDRTLKKRKIQKALKFLDLGFSSSGLYSCRRRSLILLSVQKYYVYKIKKGEMG